MKPRDLSMDGLLAMIRPSAEPERKPRKATEKEHEELVGLLVHFMAEPEK